MPRSLIIAAVLIPIGLVACASGFEQITAPPFDDPTAAVTPTHSPTAVRTLTPDVSPTDRPYDLIVALTDAEGNPITNGSVFLAEANSAFPAVVNERGLAIWQGLSGATAALTVAAQGYTGTSQSARLERGQNTVTVVLERDPKQILPAEACQPGEDVLYIEDFQNGVAQHWDWVGQGLPQGWSVAESAFSGSLALHAVGGPDEPVYYAQGVIGSYREEFDFLWIQGKSEAAIGGWFNLQSSGSISVTKVRRDITVRVNNADTMVFQSPDDLHAFQADGGSEFWVDNIVICRLP